MVPLGHFGWGLGSTWTRRTLSPPSQILLGDSDADSRLLAISQLATHHYAPSEMWRAAATRRLKAQRAAGRLAAFDLFSFKGFKCSPCLYAWETLGPHCPRLKKRERRERKLQSVSHLLPRVGLIQIKSTTYTQIFITQCCCFGVGKSHLLSGPPWC